MKIRNSKFEIRPPRLARLASRERSWAVKARPGNSSEAGVTLLFSVFVMSGVAIITLTVGFLAVQELRASRAVVRSEPAIGAADTAAERGLWQINRQNTWPTTCGGTGNAEQLPGSEAWNMKCMTWTNAVLDVAAGVSYAFFLYDPNNINGNLNPGYTNITATYKAGSFSLTIRVERLTSELVSSTTLSPGSSPIQINLPTNPADDNRFKVILSSAGKVTVDLNTNLGMPDFPMLNSEGWVENGQFKRKLHVLVPK